MRGAIVSFRSPLLVAVLCGFFAVPASAQSLGGRLREAVRNKVVEAVTCRVDDRSCIEQAKADGREVRYTDAQGNEVPEPAAESAEAADETGEGGAAARSAPGEGAWANYDFVPGDRVLYADDFTGDAVGDFPRGMEFATGALEIVEWEGTRWLRANETSRFYVVVPETLPDRFTMEFDYYIPGGEVWISLGPDENKRMTFSGLGYVGTWNHETEVQGAGEYGDGEPRLRKARVLVDGRYVKAYLDDKRILNVPNADMERSGRILFYTDASPENPALFGNFRVAAGGRKLYDALDAEGRVATQGIFFDTGSDVLRPESTPTLKEIAAMLRDHPELSLTIEGHTDSVGNAEANRTLSQKRADAVKAWLVSSEGIDAGRLETAGLGADRPAAPNDSPQGRQQNRRVELVRR